MALERADKVEIAAAAPKGAVETQRLTASLKRCPDTKRSFSAACLVLPLRGNEDAGFSPCFLALVTPSAFSRLIGRGTAMPQTRSILLVWTVLCSVVPLNSQAQTSNADWPRASAANNGLSETKLRSLDAAVRSGEFKKIGSVLIARHGKLAYEGYFEGDAGTLRDTRSATKSITDILVGIAIDEHQLTRVDAKVLSLLPERARRIQNPDSRKAEITVEDFLTMSSPLECDDWNDASRGNEERMYVVEDWAQSFSICRFAGACIWVRRWRLRAMDATSATAPAECSH